MKRLSNRLRMAKAPAALQYGMALAMLLAVSGCDGILPKPYVFDMTRLNQDGSVNDGSDFAKKPWACVKDNQSGMIWEVKAPAPGLHYANNTYTWYDQDPKTNGGWPGNAKGGVCTGSDCDTEAYIKAVNAEKLCGFADWHLPSRYEMGTIIDTSVFYPGPTFPKTYFPETLAGKYWTDTTFKTRRAGAWAWRFDYGNDYVAEKSEPLNIRLVYAAQKKVDEKTAPR